MKPAKSFYGVLTFCLMMSVNLATTSLAQGIGTPFAKGGAGAKGPIKITADSLFIRQKSKTAVFTGNVFATRGTVRLKSKKMTVYYEEKQIGGQKKTKAKLIHAEGNVHVTSKDQLAKGNWAKMDMNTGIITMGDKVFLSQGKTTLKGSKLEVNTKTGISRLLSNKKGGRVEGFFVPSK